MRNKDIQTVKKHLASASGIAWDTCHKIYILMDEKQVELMKEYGYEELWRASDLTPEVLFNTIEDWYANACSLRFIDAVSTAEDGTDQFKTLISQFANERARA